DCRRRSRRRRLFPPCAVAAADHELECAEKLHHAQGDRSLRQMAIEGRHARNRFLPDRKSACGRYADGLGAGTQTRTRDRYLESRTAGDGIKSKSGRRDSRRGQTGTEAGEIRRRPWQRGRLCTGGGGREGGRTEVKCTRRRAAPTHRHCEREARSNPMLSLRAKRSNRVRERK